MGREQVKAVLADYRSAQIPQRLRATLGFLETLIKTPDKLGPGDVRAAYRAGVSEEELRAAIYVCTLFQLMTRLADSLNYSTAGPDGSAFLLRIGYRL